MQEHELDGCEDFLQKWKGKFGFDYVPGEDMREDKLKFLCVPSQQQVHEQQRAWNWTKLQEAMAELDRAKARVRMALAASGGVDEYEYAGQHGEAFEGFEDGQDHNADSQPLNVKRQLSHQNRCNSLTQL